MTLPYCLLRESARKRLNSKGIKRNGGRERRKTPPEKRAEEYFFASSQGPSCFLCPHVYSAVSSGRHALRVPHVYSALMFTLQSPAGDTPDTPASIQLIPFLSLGHQNAQDPSFTPILNQHLLTPVAFTSYQSLSPIPPKRSPLPSIIQLTNIFCLLR